MQFRSIADMADTVVQNLHRLPADLDLVVGIPRSGLLAANLISVFANVPMTDLDSFLSERIHTSGITKRNAAFDRPFAEMRNILVVDDSILSGTAIKMAKERLQPFASGRNIRYCAIYGVRSSHEDVDYIFEVIPNPRLFQWNFIHHVFMENSCLGIDGVLCLDPAAAEDDDGAEYRRFLANARPLYRPTRKLGYLVTNRLEKYRALTEDWLRRNAIEFKELFMLDLPSKEDRQRLSINGRFKADIYKSLDADLFVESKYWQAEEITRLAGKPVLCLESFQMLTPEFFSRAAIQSRLRKLPKRLKGDGIVRGTSGLRALARVVLPDAAYAALKRRLRPASSNQVRRDRSA